jgi:hypothetical protein
MIPSLLLDLGIGSILAGLSLVVAGHAYRKRVCGP